MMSKVFIGGSRKISRLNADIRSRLDRLVAKSLPVIVGDANGVDRAIQQYLLNKKYDLVEVFCTGYKCRNNIGAWPVRHISVNRSQKDFDYYAAKDRAMAQEAAFGLMIWDGKSMGTLMNIRRLTDQDKKVAVYIGTERKFEDLKSKGDWERFVSHYASEARTRLESKTGTEKQSCFPLRNHTRTQ